MNHETWIVTAALASAFLIGFMLGAAYYRSPK